MLRRFSSPKEVMRGARIWVSGWPDDAATAGNVVVSSADGIEVNGTSIPNSRPLPGIPRVPDGRYVVTDGDLWLISSFHPASIDSRYYGPRPAAVVLRRVMPIYTW